MPRLMDIPTAAAYLGAKVWTVRGLIWDRRIKFVKLGKKQMLDRSDLDQFIDSNKDFA